MLAVSTQWHEASRSQFRYQAYLHASLEVTPPGLREGATVTASDAYPNSDVSKVIEGIPYTPVVYATLERNRWLLNGEFNLLSEVDELNEWWSKVAIEDGQPILRFSFDKPYTIPGVYFKWDTVSGTCPRTIEVIGYDSSMVQQYAVTVEHITSVEGFYSSLAMTDVMYVDIKILEWVSLGWRGRLLEVIFGFVTDFDSVNNGRIMSAVQTDKASPLNSKLPTHNMELKLRNQDKYFDATLQSGVAKYLAQQQVMKAQWAFVTSKGTIEYAPKQVYLIEKFDVPADSKEVNISLTSRLELLDGDFYYGTYTGTARTLKAIAEYVLANSSVLKEFTGQEPWVIPESFDTITTLAPIPSGATNTVLQLLALAGCSWLTTRSTDGFIEFKESQQNASEHDSVTPNQELGDPEIKIQDRLRSLSVGVYHYEADATASSIGTGEYTLSGVNTIVMKYNTAYATNVSASVSGATLTSARYFASYAILVVTASADNSVVKITLSGTIVKSTVSYLETYRNTSIADGKDVTIENPLITSVAHAQQVAEHVKNYYLRRNNYTIPYIGYPQLEASDKINLETIYGSDVVEVTSNKVDFNGGWTGTLEVI